jgi:hypothetical protein
MTTELSAETHDGTGYGIAVTGEDAPDPVPSLDALAVDTLRHGNVLRMCAHGGSMLPFLRDGDIVVVAPVGTAEIRIGDVICYQPPSGGLCLHRVIARAERSLVTRGDALAYVDTVPHDAVLGLVIARERRGRAVSLGTRRGRRCGWLLARVAPAVARLLPPARAVRRAGRTILGG